MTELVSIAGGELQIDQQFANGGLQVQVEQTFTTQNAENLKRFGDRKDQLEANTLKSFEFNYNKFRKYCIKVGATPLPLNDATVLEDFLISEFERGIKVKTLRVYAWAVMKMHTIAELEIPHFKAVVSARLTILSKEEVKLGVKRNQASPLTHDNLKFINSLLDSNNLKTVRDTLILNIAYDGLLRESEVANIFVEQIHKHGALFNINITNTKTDKSLDGSLINLSKYTSRLLAFYLTKVSAHKGRYLFKRLTPNGGKLLELAKVKADSLSMADLDKAMTTRSISTVFKNAWNTIDKHNETASFEDVLELPERPYSGHSARVGAACDLVESGCEDSMVQRAGRWKSSAMVELYTRGVNAKLATVRNFRDALD